MFLHVTREIIYNTRTPGGKIYSRIGLCKRGCFPACKSLLVCFYRKFTSACSGSSKNKGAKQNHTFHFLHRTDPNKKYYFFFPCPVRLMECMELTTEEFGEFQ